MPPFVLAGLVILSLNVYFCFTQFGGRSHCLSIDKIRDITPLPGTYLSNNLSLSRYKNYQGCH